MMQRGRAILFITLVAALLPFGGALAQENQADATTDGAQAGQTFDDWGRRCETLPNGEELCLIFQRLRLKENNQTILHVSFGYPPLASGPVLVFTTPLGVSLMAGMEVQVDDVGEATKVAYNICVADGCRASLSVSDELLQAMRAGDKLKVAFANSQNKALGMQVSLKGFSEASDSLKK
ncbi:invasion associated locus B family protein [Sedimenticola thiotaurini]|uniref:invasion associated locus B family protein n=1 Tax=Sedimenticola thiotaurini TaxID=1543721 RepID=UPI00069B594D|nr:invasion associated locus B family protein [Sedimenticola thiotaurini]